MPHHLARLALVGCLPCGLVACDRAGGDWVPSDIDEQQTLDRLGSAGYQKLCAAFDGYVRDTYRSNTLVKAACTAHALQTTQSATACGVALDACLDDLPPVVEAQLTMILAQADCGAVDVTQAACSSPVSELTACLDDLGEQLDTIELSLTCAAFGSPVPPDWWRISPPSSCAALGSRC